MRQNLIYIIIKFKKEKNISNKKKSKATFLNNSDNSYDITRYLNAVLKLRGMRGSESFFIVYFSIQALSICTLFILGT